MKDESLQKEVITLLKASKHYAIHPFFAKKKSDFANWLREKDIHFCFLDEEGFNALDTQFQTRYLPAVLITDNPIEKNPFGISDSLLKQDLNTPLLDKVIQYTREHISSSHYLSVDIGNRDLFNEKLSFLVERAVRHQHSLALLLLDLDQFQQVNDTFGHHYGDLLLQEVAGRLKNNLRKVDYVFWMGGDEFMIVVEGLLNEQKIIQLASKLINSLIMPFVVDEQQCQISTSIGITIASGNNMRSAEQLSKEAYVAMYRAKKNGRNNFQLYQPDFLAEFLQYSHLMQDLQKALENKEFNILYQPLVSLASNTIIGVEALIRWQHPTLGIIPPSVFIPIAEKTGLILAIGEWVLKEACLQRKTWEDLDLHQMLIAINISIFQLQQPNFVRMVLNIIEMTGINPKMLELEISESVITTNFEDCTKKMQELKEYGIRFVIDDFGTGYSNLGYLKHFPFDKIKIDKMFIDEITSNNREQHIVDAIINMAKKMKLEIVAEGVETEEQVNYLRQHHSLEVQGFYYSEPLSSEECTAKLISPDAP